MAFSVCALSALVMLGPAPPALASTTLLGDYGGHQYYLCSSGDIAAARAEAGGLQSSLGRPAYLATINDAEEEAWIRSRLSNPEEALWIGLSDEIAEGDFRWDNGEPVTYTHWVLAEPTDFGFCATTGSFCACEDHVVLNGHPNFNGGWNDVAGNCSSFRGVIEVAAPHCDCPDVVLAEAHGANRSASDLLVAERATLRSSWGQLKTRYRARPVESDVAVQDPAAVSTGPTRLRTIASFIAVESPGRQTFLAEEARATGLGAADIATGQALVELQNRLVDGADRASAAEPTPQEIELLDDLFVAAPTSPCGGFDSPTPCPPRIEQCQFFPTREAAIAALELQGYHQTAAYVPGEQSNDFTQPVETAACGPGAFRMHAVVHLAAGGSDCWTFSTQGIEPNPEILSYQWPTPWWGGYVNWWRRQYCR